MSRDVGKFFYQPCISTSLRPHSRPQQRLGRVTVNSEVRIEACQSGRPQSLKNSKLFLGPPRLLQMTLTKGLYYIHVEAHVIYCYMDMDSSASEIPHDRPGHPTEDALHDHDAEGRDAEEAKDRPDLSEDGPVVIKLLVRPRRLDHILPDYTGHHVDDETGQKDDDSPPW